MVARALDAITPFSGSRSVSLVRLGEAVLIAASALVVLDVNRWVLHGAMFFFGDEFGNLGRVYWQSYPQIFNFLPEIVYNDRPVGFLFIRILYDAFGFDYLKQMAVLQLLHFVNFGLVFLVVRKLLDSTIFALVTASLFAANASTIASAWYLGAIFDVLCALFLFASFVTYLGGGIWRLAISPILLFFALRSKEVAAVFPLLLVLLEWRSAGFDLRPRTFAAVLRRVGPHLAVLAIVLAAYASHFGEYTAGMATQPDNPYQVSWAPASLLSTLDHYVARVLYQGTPDPDTAAHGYWLLLVALVVCAVAFRRFWIFFGVAGFVALLLAVLIIPQHTADYYLYAPFAFLALAVSDVLRLTAQTIERRFHLADGLADVTALAAVLGGLVVLSQTQYNATQIEFLRTSRQIMFRDAQPVLDQELRFGHGAHYYVSGLRPYLNVFSSGPCYFLQIYYGDHDIRCFVEMPTDRLESLYAADTAERYFFDYRDWNLILRTSAPAPSGKGAPRS